MIFPHKICDPIHGFIRFESIEGKVIDSLPFQRLRYLHQMGVVYLLYPGATHCRFQHSLGVMEVATRIFDTITNPQNLFLEGVIPREKLPYYRRILRLAALCHDLGHLPFSHTAEEDLLPISGHEEKTLLVIRSASMRKIWREIPDYDPQKIEEDIIKFAVGEKFGLQLSTFEKVLSQVITEDNFGADRIDYLLRDAYFTGVGYGHFDYRQLIDTLRIIRDNDRLAIGIIEGGIQSVESLWMARYLMYARVYHHSKARIYTKHMMRFMKNYYSKRGFPATIVGYLQESDYTLLHEMQKAFDNEDASALFKRTPCYKEVMFEKDPGPYLQDLERTFEGKIFVDKIPESSSKRDFAVISQSGKVISSFAASKFLSDIPIGGGKPLRIYADPSIHNKVKDYLS